MNDQEHLRKHRSCKTSLCAFYKVLYWCQLSQSTHNNSNYCKFFSDFLTEIHNWMTSTNYHLYSKIVHHHHRGDSIRVLFNIFQTGGLEDMAQFPNHLIPPSWISLNGVIRAIVYRTKHRTSLMPLLPSMSLCYSEHGKKSTVLMRFEFILCF